MPIVLSLVLVVAQTAPAPTAPVSDLERLEQASNKGDLAAVEQLLTARPEWVDARDETGVSFMLNALYRRRAEVVQAYVRRRATFNLFESGALGRTRDLEAILRKEPESVNSYSADGFIALGLASFFAQAAAVKLLLANGADVKLFGRTPRVQALHSAAAGRCVECVRALLAAGADPNSPQDGGFRALHEAGRTMIARWLNC